MAEFDDRLKQLLSDENGMKQFMEVASALLGKSEAKSPAGETATSATQANTTQANATSNSPPMSDMLSALLSQIGSSSGQGSPAASSDAASSTASSPSVLPQLLHTLSDKNVQINEQRLNLVKAMRPYLAESRAASIDRAVKMANVAKAAKNALGLLGR